MWSGVFPAVTTKYTADDEIDHAEMERCITLMAEAGCDGFIMAGSLGEGSMLSVEEKLAILKTAQGAASGRPVLLTINEAATRDAVELARKAAVARADGLMVVPSPIYHTDARETVDTMEAVASASGLPVMIYSNRVAYRVDVTLSIMEELARNELFVAIKESSDDIRRTTDVINTFGDRFDLFTGVDNLAFEALTMGAVGWVAGLVVAFPRETVAIDRLIKAGRFEEARSIYRWFRPLLDLDVSTYLVQNIKLAEVHVIGSNDRVRMPRQPLRGERRAEVEAIILEALSRRPALPEF